LPKRPIARRRHGTRTTSSSTSPIIATRCGESTPPEELQFRLTKFDNGKHTTHRWPQFLPDGKHFLFFATNHSGDSEHGIYFGSVQDGSYKHVLDGDSGGQYASGYLLYHLQSQIAGTEVRSPHGTISGDPITVANFVEYDTGTWHTTFAVSQNGLLVYEPGSKTLGTDLFWMDRSGKTLSQVAERAFYKGSGRISPDGKTARRFDG